MSSSSAFSASSSSVSRSLSASIASGSIFLTSQSLLPTNTYVTPNPETGYGPRQTRTPNDPSPPSTGSSAALYLYTFLATLILLLGVSSAIVIRSLILRRRHRRMLEEAIRNGTWLPQPPTRRVDLSKKPKIFEAYVGEERLEQGLTDREGKLKQVVGMGSNHAEWSTIKPFSLVPVSQSLPSESQPEPPVVPAAPPTLLSRLRPARFLRPRSVPPPPPPNLPVTAPAATSVLPDSVHVSVLIAMPSRTPIRRTTADDEPELPQLQIGVSTVPIVGHEVEGNKRSSGESV